MNASKIIKGVVGGGRYTVTAPITQWDYGYIFVPEIEDLPATYRLDFSNDEHQGTALPVYCGADGGKVPKQLIDTGKDIFVWYFFIGDGYGKSCYKWRIPNKLKPKTSEDEPTPSQQSSIDQLIVRSNEAVETAETSASEASTSAQNAREYADRAESARNTAGEYASNAETSATNAQTSYDNLTAYGNQAIRELGQIVDDVQTYANTATTAAEEADAKANSILNLTASARTLPEGSSASASYNAQTGVMSFGIPKGDKGDKGDEYILTAQDKQDIADIVDVPTKVYHPRITALNNAKIMAGEIVEVSEIPEYVDDPSKYSEYGITEDGWYVFARIRSKGLDTVSAQTRVVGADGYISNEGASYVDVAIRFEVAATSKTIAVTWNTNDTEVFVFKATDLAVRNLDYRTTFYVYDITPYRTWIYALTTDTKFVSDKNYYILSDGEYVLAEVTVGSAVPANTYYNHSKLHFEGMARNVTYNLAEIVDCPIEIVLPEIPKNGYGAWFDIQMRYDGTHSCTLLPPEGVKIGTAQTQSQTKGVNIFELQYTDAGDVKMWTLLNTHSNIPS